MRSMPFLADILLKIYDTLGVNWERAGNVRFAVVYKPQGDALDRVTAQERSHQIAREWSLSLIHIYMGTSRFKDGIVDILSIYQFKLFGFFVNIVQIMSQKKTDFTQRKWIAAWKRSE